MSLAMLKRIRPFKSRILCGFFVLAGAFSPVSAAPSISIEKSAYLGEDGGMSCPGNASTRASTNAPITYCFIVQNTGDEDLSNVQIIDNNINFTTNITSLAVGGAVTSFVASVVTGDVVNVANVFAQGTNGDSVVDSGSTYVDAITDCPSECFIVSDVSNNSSDPLDTDFLLSFDLNTASTTVIATNGTGAFCLENLTFAPIRLALGETSPDLFAAEGCGIGSGIPGRLGTINITNGVWTGYSNVIGSARGYHPGDPGFLTTIQINDIDGLVFDTTSGQGSGANSNSYQSSVLWAAVRTTGLGLGGANGKAEDILININPDTGMIISNAFNDPVTFEEVDYIVVSNIVKTVTSSTGVVSTKILHDIDDIAVDETRVGGFNQLVLIMNDGGTGDELVIIDKSFGSTVGTGPLVDTNNNLFTDMEGLSFSFDGDLFGSAGTDGNPPNSLFLIGDKDERSADFGLAITNGTTLSLGFINATNPLNGSVFSDFEGLDCFRLVVEQLNSISGTAFYDPIFDGVYDGNETLIAGAQIDLFQDVNTNGVLDVAEASNPVASTTTDASGFYSFNVSKDIAYFVRLDDGISSRPESCGATSPTLLAIAIPDLCGFNEVATDFGVATCTAIGDFVWDDLNEDGIQNVGEPGVTNVFVSLLDASAGFITNTTTDASGMYLFQKLSQSNYVVEFDLPPDYVRSPQYAGSTTNDSDADITTGRTGIISTTNPFPDTVLIFTNDTVDAGISLPNDVGVTKTSSFPSNGTGQVTFDYVFTVTNVGPRVATNIVVEDTLPLGLDFVTGAIGTYTPSNRLYTVTLPSLAAGNTTNVTIQVVVTNNIAGALLNEVCVILDLPETTSTNNCSTNYLAILGDFLFVDEDANGVQSGSEPGVAGQLVTLLDTNFNAVGTTTTDPSGLYYFTVPEGDYVVEFSAPTNVSFTTANATTNDAIDSDADVITGRTADYTLLAQTTNLTIDAGLVAPVIVLEKSVSTALGSSSNAMFNFVLSVSNAGSSVATDVNVFDPLPIGLIANSVGPAPATYNAVDRRFEVTIPSLLPGASLSYTIAVEVVDSAAIDALTPQVDSVILPADAVDCTTFATNSLSTNALENIAKAALTFLSTNTVVVDCDNEILAMIGDFVFVDEVLNGQQDAGEPGVPGFAVQLQDTNGLLLASTLTDTNGYYEFVVPAGIYQVAFVAPTGTAFTTKNVGPDATDSDADEITGISDPVIVFAGQINRTIDAGIIAPELSMTKLVTGMSSNSTTETFAYVLIISNTAAADAVNVSVIDKLPAGITYLNDNGAGGTGTGSVYENTLPLLAGNTSTSITLNVQVSDAPGIDFASPTNDLTNVAVALFDCSAFTTNSLSSTNVLQNNAKAVVQIPFSTNVVEDCDEERLALIGDYVFLDINTNGVQDTGDLSRSGITVNLLDATGTTNLASMVTDGNGEYEFVVPAGTYIVHFGLPSTYSFTTNNAGGNDGLDSDADPVTGRAPPVTVAAGDINRTIDAGLLSPNILVLKDTGPATASASNVVFTYSLIVTNFSSADALNVSLIDPLPLGLGFVDDGGSGGLYDPVTRTYSNLLADVAGNTSTSITLSVTVTNAAVIEANVDPSDRATMPVDPLNCFAFAPGILSTNALQNTVKIELAISNVVETIIDCDADRMSLLGDYVFMDLGADGLQGSDPGIAGVTVNLQDTSGVQLASTITDTNGYYEFVVPAGDYRVGFEPPPGLAFTLQYAGVDDGADSDVDSAGLSGIVSLLAGEIDRTIDAGLLPPDITVSKLAGPLLAGGPDAVFEYELIVSNVTASDAVNAQVIDPLPAGLTFLSDNPSIGGTNANNVYVGMLPSLAANSSTSVYLRVRITDPDSIEAALPTNDFTTVAIDPIDCSGISSNSTPSTNTLQNNVKVIVPIPFTTNVVIDCDEELLGLVGDFVFVDADQNGLQNGEPGVPNFGVELLDTNASVLATTMTDSNGYYEFVVPAGTYVLQFVSPSGVAFTIQGSVPNAGNDSNADATGRTDPVTIPAGGINRTIDAGILPPDLTITKAIGSGQASTNEMFFTYTLTVTNNSASGVTNALVEDPLPQGVTFVSDSPAIGTAPGNVYSANVDLAGNTATSIVLTVSIDPAGAALIEAAAAAGQIVTTVVDAVNCITYSDSATLTNSLQNTARVSYNIPFTTNIAVDCDDALLALIGDFVFMDEDLDGQQDPLEPGVPGVTVNLQDTNNTVLASTLTDSSGLYRFVVPAGDYVVEFSEPAGLAFTSQNVGSDFTDSDADFITGRSGVVTVGPGEINRTIDAGLLPPQITFTKLVSAATAGTAGEQFAYMLIVSNVGPSDAVNAFVFDVLPTGISFVDDNGSGGAISGLSLYTNTLALVPGNTSTTLTLNVIVSDSSTVNGVLPTNDVIVVAVDPVTCVGFTTNSPSSTNALQNNAKVEVSIPFSTNTVIDCDDERTALIGDYVWLDLNGDGLQDGTDIAQSNITVNLRDATGVTNLATKVTDAAGKYEFIVPAGTYVLQFIAPAGVAFTTQGTVPNAGNDSDASSTGFTDPVTVVAGGINRTIDAGLIAADIDLFKTFGNVLTPVNDDYTYEYILTITNISASDAINAELIDPLPLGLGYNGDGLAGGTYSAATRTYSNTLALIPAGSSTSVTISVSVTNALAIMGTFPVTGSYPADTTVSCTNLSSSALSTNALENVARVSLTLTGSNIRTVDCDNNRLALIGDYAFSDEDLSGDQSAPDLPLPNTFVDLLEPTGSNVLATTFTDVNGLYAFAVTPGTYRVRFIIPDFYDIAPPNVGGDDELDSDADPSDGPNRGMTAPVTVNEGDVNRSLDAGIIRNDLNIFGSVLFDDNNDGDFAGTNPPIANVPVDLYFSLVPCPATNIAQGFLVDSTVTDTNGNWAFTNLLPSCYFVVENNLTNYVSTADTDGPNDDLISVLLTTNDSAGNVFLDTLPIVLGDYVFNDSNADGSQVGEMGISNVMVNLLDTNLAVVGTTTTDVSGAYSFTILPGEYTIEFVPSSLPPNFGFTTPNVGDDEQDSDADIVTGRTSSTGFLLAGTTNLTLDAGAYELGCIGDTVWADGNGDGIPGEPLATEGIPNVLVTLAAQVPGGGYVDVASMDTVATATNRGFYNFCDLRVGTYRVTVDDEDPAIPLNLSFSNSTPLVYFVTMVPGLSSDTNDFGFVELPTAVTLTRFTATATEDGVLTEWSTSRETDTLGFNVYRSDSADGERVQVGNFVLSSGDASGGSYRLLDPSNASGFYWLEEMEQDFDTATYGPAIVEGTADGVIGTVDVENEGIYRILLDDPSEAGVTVDGQEVAALEGPDYLIVYVPYGGAEVVVANIPSAKRMGLVERDPNYASSQLEIVPLDQEGNASFQTSVNADNYLVLGFEGQPVVLDTTDAYNPVAIIGMALESTSAATQTTVTALYFGYDADRDVFASDLDPDE